MTDFTLMLERALAGQTKMLWPDWHSTKDCTENIRPAKKRLPKGREVTPLEEYSFHTSFSTETDGRQWLFRSEKGILDHAGLRVLSVMSMGGALFFLFGTLMLFFNNNDEYPWLLLITTALVITCALCIYKARTGGQDTWVILDRTTGNVCFWNKNQENSLTVPFEQVKCYWVHAYQRGGHSYHFVLMPEVSLPNERARWWPTLMGFPLTYQQAQYFWRVLCDFMEPNGTVPEVPGLVHQVRACERLGYTIEDITEGGKTIPEEVFQEVAEEIDQEFETLTMELDALLKPDRFNAQSLHQFYSDAPVFFKKKTILETRMVYKRLFIGLDERNQMHPRFSPFFSMEDYRAEVRALGDWLVKVIGEEELLA